MSRVAVRTLAGAPPAGFAALVAEAQAEGFERPAGAGVEAEPPILVLTAETAGALAGIGALAADAGHGVLRIYNVFVRPAFRRAGVGRALAQRLIAEGAARGRALVLTAATPQACAFWRAMGFARTGLASHTHELAFAERSN